MKNLIISFTLLAALFIMPACQEPAPPPQDVHDVDLTPEKNAIAQQSQRFADALKKGDTNTIGALYTSDAKILDQDAPAISGTESIVGHYVSILQDSITGMRFTSLGAWGNETILVEEGTLEVTNAKGEVVDRGKSLVVWKKVDGEWKIFRDMYNSDGPLN
jgi:ketosteroid isomerase-like protein